MHDGVLVEWPRGAKAPRVARVEEPVGPDALGSGFWDLLLGLVFVLPGLAAAKDESPAQVWGALADGGIDEAFLEGVSTGTGRGTSSLWLLHADDISALLDELLQESASPVVASLDGQRFRALQQVFPA